MLFESLLEKAKIPLPPHLDAAEIGCGQGAFLFPFASTLISRGIGFNLTGYDISPQAITLAQERCPRTKNNSLTFKVGSADDIPSGLDFVFCMDVLEHVENPFLFLRTLSNKAEYVIIHLPIEGSIAHLLLNSASKSYARFQHLHFFSWGSAQILFKESPFEILDHQFTATSPAFMRLGAPTTTRALRLAKWLIYKIAPRTASKIAGGSVLFILRNRPH